MAAVAAKCLQQHRPSLTAVGREQPEQGNVRELRSLPAAQKQLIFSV